MRHSLGQLLGWTVILAGTVGVAVPIAIMAARVVVYTIGALWGLALEPGKWLP